MTRKTIDLSISTKEKGAASSSLASLLADFVGFVSVAAGDEEFVAVVLPRGSSDRISVDVAFRRSRMAFVSAMLKSEELGCILYCLGKKEKRRKG